MVRGSSSLCTGRVELLCSDILVVVTVFGCKIDKEVIPRVIHSKTNVVLPRG